MSKLSNFPIPAQGETIYSVICRYLARTGFSMGYVLSSLTNQMRTHTFLSRFPGYINRISSSIQGGHVWSDPAEIVCRHTALPYYLYFLPEIERQQWILKLSSSIYSSSTELGLGLRKNRKLSASLHPRYCVQCSLEQIKEYGFSFFKVHHQLPGVFVCSKHKQLLNNGCKICGQYPIKKNLYMPGKCLCDVISPLPVLNGSYALKSLLWIASESEYMVSNGTRYLNSRAILRQAALQEGFGRGRLLNSEMLAAEIERFFGKDFLDLIGVQVWTEKKPSPWIRRILNVSHASKKPAIQLLLVVGALFDSLKDFERWQKSKEPLLAPKKKTEKFYNLKSLVTKFKICEIARRYGVHYLTIIREARRQCLRVPLSSRIKRRFKGNLFNIRKELRAGISKKEIMKRYRCSDAILLAIEIDQPALTESHRQATKKNLKDKHRKILLDFLEHNPNASRDEIIKFSGSYSYLSKYDTKWYCKQIPAKKRPERQPIRRKNWAHVDAQKTQELKQVVDQFYNEDEKPILVSRTRLLKRIDFFSRSFGFLKKKCPTLMSLVEQSSETFNEYIMRRLIWGIKECKKQNELLSLQKLRLIIGLDGRIVRRYESFIFENAECLGVTISRRTMLRSNRT